MLLFIKWGKGYYKKEYVGTKNQCGTSTTKVLCQISLRKHQVRRVTEVDCLRTLHGLDRCESLPMYLIYTEVQALGRQYLRQELRLLSQIHLGCVTLDSALNVCAPGPHLQRRNNKIYRMGNCECVKALGRIPGVVVSSQ